MIEYICIKSDCSLLLSPYPHVGSKSRAVSYTKSPMSLRWLFVVILLPIRSYIPHPSLILYVTNLGLRVVVQYRNYQHPIRYSIHIYSVYFMRVRFTVYTVQCTLRVIYSLYIEQWTMFILYIAFTKVCPVPTVLFTRYKLHCMCYLMLQNTWHCTMYNARRTMCDGH